MKVFHVFMKEAYESAVLDEEIICNTSMFVVAKDRNSAEGLFWDKYKQSWEVPDNTLEFTVTEVDLTKEQVLEVKDL